MALVCGSCGTQNPEQARYCLACGTALGEGPRGRKERKVATALFADLVGSTALAEREDPEVVQSVIGRAFDRAAVEIERHGGLLEKFIGDAILAVFGVPTVHEDDPERAVRAALAVRALLDELNEGFAAEGRPELSLRIGVEAGEVLVDLERAEGPRHRMLTGDAVNIAARLEQAAAPGRIVVGPAVFEATSTRIAYRPLPPFALKGKALPVPAWEALGIAAGASAERIPLRLGSRLVGRDGELARLERALTDVRSATSPTLVTVLGPAGIGKSRLAYEFLQRLERAREVVTVRKGRCLSYGNVSYSALAEAVKAECGVHDDDLPEVVAGKATAAVERLLGDRELAPHVEALIGSARDRSFGREDLFDAWRRVLERVADGRTLLLVLEDLHWGDDGLLDFIEHLARWGRGPILILALARPDLLERRPAWGDAVPSRLRVTLGPLTPEESDAMLEGLLGTRLPPALARVVLDRSEGNPLFTEEFVRMLIDRDVLRPTAAVTWELVEPVENVEVPRSIQALVAARLDALPTEEKRVLQDASVVGRTFWEGALQRLCDLAPERVGTALDGLRAKELVALHESSTWSGEREFAFHHALIRDVAYDSLPKALRAEKHVATARWAEEQAGHRRDEIAELLATHQLQALRWLDELGQADGTRREVERDGYRWASAAGRRARRLWQQREAVRWLRAALELGARIGCGDAELAPLWESYALAADGVEPYADVVTAWEAALVRYEREDRERDAGRVEARMAHAALWAGRFEVAGRRATGAVERLEPLGESPELAFALYALGRFELERDRVDRAEPLLRRARDLAERVGDLATQANATISLGWTLHARGRGKETVRLFDAALGVARRAGDLALLLDTLEAVFSAAIEVDGDHLRAQEVSVESLELARRTGNVGKLARVQLNMAYLLRELGRLDEAETSGLAALGSAEGVGDPLLVAYVNAVLALGACPRGRLEEAERRLAACRTTLEEERIEYVMYVDEFDALVTAYAAEGRGDAELAASVLAEASDRLSDERLSVWLGQLLLFECVRALVRLGRLEESLPHRGRLERLAIGNAPPRAFLAWADGLLEPDPGRARDLLAEACDRFEVLGRRIDLGRCLLDLTEAERRLGEPGADATWARGVRILEDCDARLFLHEPNPHPA
jgi:class 3 adenylate cyclase/tetratricopeptide (TPR) repeat protein